MSRKIIRLLLIVLALGVDSARAQLPVLGSSGSHDPSTMIKNGASYFVYSDGQGISVLTTTNLRNWNYTSAVFPSGPPAWTTNDIPAFAGYFWAPDIAYFNGRYNLYYCCSEWATRNSAIGVVTSPSLTSPVWTDQGKVVESYYPLTAHADTLAYNCIDPSILVATNGSVWMSYGSYSDGIVVTQIDPATGKRLNPASLGSKVSSSSLTYDQNTEEGSFIYQHGGYYYLFVNFGGCCAGIDSTYNIRVGRSATATGPYLDKNGVNMIGGGGTMLLESIGRFIGPGHPGILNDNGTNWFTYHYYDGKNNGAATLGLMRLTWTDDEWPALTSDWNVFYTFEADAREHRGLYNGSLRNGATVTNEPDRGEALALDGNANYATLPSSVANASTFAAWVKWNGGADSQRIFDFGGSSTKYLYLTPSASNGRMRFAIRNGGGEQQLDAPFALASNAWQHVAITLNGSRGVLFLNGDSIATNTSMTIRPWQLLTRSNYLGKSPFNSSTQFKGRIDSFRIFGRALTPDEIRDLAWAQPMLAHRYSFTSNAWDSIGGANGKLLGNAVITNGALVLDGTSGSHLDLPGGLVSGASAVTVEFWATFGANGDWARVFDFGNSSGANGVQYFFFSPHAGSGQRMEIRTNVTVTMDIPGSLDNHTVHVVCLVDPPNNYAAIYTNGVLEQSMTAAWPKLASVNQNWSYLGRSLFSGDAWLNGSIDEFRIYDGRLTPEEIAVNHQFGPNALALPVSVISSNSPSGLNLSWPSYDVGFVPESATALDANWTTVTSTPSLTSDAWQVTIPTTNSARFYRLQRQNEE